VDHEGSPAIDHCPEAAPGPATSSSNAESVMPTSSSGQGSSTAATACDAPGPSGGEGGKDRKEEEEEESDLKLAWEMLELARVICQK